MDQKTWLWRKKASEKTILATLEEEKELDLENSLKILNEELASVVDECSAKDELVQNYKKTAEDATADKAKAEEETQRLKVELEQQKMASNERLAHLNSVFKDCMNQLNSVRHDQDQMVRNAVMKTSTEFEKSHKKLEEKLSETNNRLASATAENSYLSKALLVKEKLMEDLNTIKNQTEAEFRALMARLDSVEKENAFLRYEFMSLEKELHLRNEELDYNRRSLEASNRQHLESGKKIKKLEAECQRLRALTHKRLPGPGLLANLQSHIEVEGRHQGNLRRNVVNGGSVDHTNKQLSFLIDQLQDLQKENRIFKECLAKKEEEICSLTNKERAIALVSGSDDKSTDQKTEPECTMMASEMRLMDDFVEMEKLAIVAVDSSLGASDDSSCGIQMDSMGKELVPVGQGDYKKPDDWLEVVRNAVLEQQNVSKKSLDELLTDVRVSLHGTVHSEPSKLLPISGYLTWKSPTSSPRSSLNQESSTELMQSISKMIELVGRFDSSPSDDLPVNNSSSYKIHVFGWKKSELATVLQGFMYSCNNLMDGKIDFEKFSGDLASVVGWIIEKSILYHGDSGVGDEFRKHLGGDGPGTALELESVQNLMLAMEKMHSVFQVEIQGLKKELMSFIKSSDEEMEFLKESKGKTEDENESLKLINEDLDTQLCVARAKLSELVQKLSSVEVELDNKSHHCEELEGTCLELQLQVESVRSNRHSDNDENKEGVLQTELEITKATAKLAECEETILKLGKQLKTLGSAKELSVVDKVVDTRNNKLKQRSSLLDQMLCEDNAEVTDPDSPKTKEIISTTEANALVPAGFSFPDGQVAPPTPYLGTKKELRNARAGALVIVPSKKRGGGGIGLLRKLLLRRKKSSTPIYFTK
ncbi:hypothetical protein ACS0TY_002655 [Phlomoides rotata]